MHLRTEVRLRVVAAVRANIRASARIHDRVAKAMIHVDAVACDVLAAGGSMFQHGD